MRIFAYKLATYLSTGDVAGLQNALFRGSCRVSIWLVGIPGSYSYRVWAGVRELVFGCIIIIIIHEFQSDASPEELQGR